MIYRFPGVAAVQVFNTVQNEQTYKLSILQLQRDFLRKHAQHFPSGLQDLKLPVDPTSSKNSLDANVSAYMQFLQTQIKVYTEHLERQRSQNSDYIAGVLLKKSA